MLHKRLRSIVTDVLEFLVLRCVPENKYPPLARFKYFLPFLTPSPFVSNALIEYEWSGFIAPGTRSRNGSPILFLVPVSPITSFFLCFTPGFYLAFVKLQFHTSYLTAFSFSFRHLPVNSFRSFVLYPNRHFHPMPLGFSFFSTGLLAFQTVRRFEFEES